jgi:hypothetical protein
LRDSKHVARCQKHFPNLLIQLDDFGLSCVLGSEKKRSLAELARFIESHVGLSERRARLTRKS